MGKGTKVIILILAALMAVGQLSAQEATADTTKTDPVRKQAVRATLMSSVIPGLGQVYNKKYWKVPILYAGFGTIVYFIHKNNAIYQEFKEAYDNINSPGPYQPYLRPQFRRLDDAQIEDYFLKTRDAFQRYRDLNIIVLAGLYILNIIDASVDANFLSYDVGRSLSMNIKPSVIQQTNPPFLTSRNFVGVKYTLNFH